MRTTCQPICMKHSLCTAAWRSLAMWHWFKYHSRISMEWVSLGTSVNCSIAAIEVARLKIAVVNPNVPFAYGDLVPISAFDHLVYDESPLITKDFVEPSEIDKQIGKNCAELVPDGARIQMGIGALSNALASQLEGHKNLGVNTEMFAAGVLRLIEKGVINGACKD